MRILYTALKYDYGIRSQGYGFEHYNFFESVLNMGHDILYFDMGELRQTYDRATLSRRLWEVVHAEQPDLLFAVLQGDELDPVTIHRISTSSSTITFNWFCDDHWRFESFSRRW